MATKTDPAQVAREILAKLAPAQVALALVEHLYMVRPAHEVDELRDAIEAQVRAVQQQARREALEEAAQIVKSLGINRQYEWNWQDGEIVEMTRSQIVAALRTATPEGGETT